MRPRRRPGKRWTPRPSLQWVLDKFTSPAIIRNGRMDLLASNHLGRAMHAALYDAAAGGQPNFARFIFLDVDAAHDFYPDWDGAADTCIAVKVRPPTMTRTGVPPDDDALSLGALLDSRGSGWREAGASLIVFGVVGSGCLGLPGVVPPGDVGPGSTEQAAAVVRMARVSGSVQRQVCGVRSRV